MMMMPFVRLIAIYALVGAAIFAFLKRDEIMAAINPPEDPAFAHPIALPIATPAAQEDAAVAAAPASAPAAKAPEAEAEAEAEAQSQPAPAASQPANARPAFGSQITPQYFGETAAPSAAAPAPTPAPAQDDLVTRWTKAREVFSQGKPADAARLYEALTADFPDNADLHGEVGNLYYNLGDFAKAATHYEAVGEIAHRAGNGQMANNMLALLQRIAPAKAAALQAVINGN